MKILSAITVKIIEAVRNKVASVGQRKQSMKPIGRDKVCIKGLILAMLAISLAIPKRNSYVRIQTPILC
jgi:hypothetical protein